jgi:hypothetical protein
MLSEETLAQYRKMSISERLQLTLDAMRRDWPYLVVDPENWTTGLGRISPLTCRYFGRCTDARQAEAVSAVV